MLILDKILEQAIRKLLDEYFGEEIEATRNQCGFPKDKSLKNFNVVMGYWIHELLVNKKTEQKQYTLFIPMTRWKS